LGIVAEIEKEGVSETPNKLPDSNKPDLSDSNKPDLQEKSNSNVSNTSKDTDYTKEEEDKEIREGKTPKLLKEKQKEINSNAAKDINEFLGGAFGALGTAATTYAVVKKAKNPTTAVVASPLMFAVGEFCKKTGTAAANTLEIGETTIKIGNAIMGDDFESDGVNPPSPSMFTSTVMFHSPLEAAELFHPLNWFLLPFKFFFNYVDITKLNQFVIPEGIKDVVVVTLSEIGTNTLKYIRFYTSCLVYSLVWIYKISPKIWGDTHINDSFFLKELDFTNLLVVTAVMLIVLVSFIFVFMFGILIATIYKKPNGNNSFGLAFVEYFKRFQLKQASIISFLAFLCISGLFGIYSLLGSSVERAIFCLALEPG
jgi:hypothetical protein